ncbi:MAG: hypothetical protein D6768_21090, partial [Chloroflexi bacterium]
PPYESVFVDPTAMLLAPATERVQQVYRQAGWTLPANRRAGAPDHIGLQLLALADMYAAGQNGPAQRLHAEHLALWVPALAATLRRLQPHLFYATLSDLTLELLLGTLPETAVPAANPFPVLPPPPVFRGSGPDEFAPGAVPSPPESGEEVRLRDLVRQFMIPRDAGLYLTRRDIAGLAQSLELPKGMGDRAKMLETLFRQAGEFDSVPDLVAQIELLVVAQAEIFHRWQMDYPAWEPLGQAWQTRLEQTRARLQQINATVEAEVAHLHMP